MWNLHRVDVVVKGRAVADVCDPFVAVAGTLHCDGIHPCFGSEFVMQADICRWKAQQLPAAIAAMFNSATDLIVASQKASVRLKPRRPSPAPGCGCC